MRWRCSCFPECKEGTFFLFTPAALSADGLVMARFLGCSILENFLVARGSPRLHRWPSAVFSEDWRARSFWRR
jgi:hypothetical protein